MPPMGRQKCAFLFLILLELQKESSKGKDGKKKLTFLSLSQQPSHRFLFTRRYISVYLDRLIALNEQRYTFAISLYFFLSWVDSR